MNEAAKMAQEMSGWTDKALFLFTLIVLIGVFFWAVKYLLKRNERQGERLEGLFQEANAGRIEVAKALTANTDVMCETREQLRECTEFFKRAKH